MSENLMIFSLNLHENHNVPAENIFLRQTLSLIEIHESFKIFSENFEVGFQCFSMLDTGRNKFIKFCEVNFKTNCDLQEDLRK